MEIEIREETLPGIGRRWEMPVRSGKRVLVIVHRGSGRRDVSIAARGADEPDCSVVLSAEEAVALAGLLTGARVVTVSSEERKRPWAT